MSKKTQPTNKKGNQNMVGLLPKKGFDPYLLLLGIGVIIVSIIRFQLLRIPLERDEGEYAYMGQLILDGVAPYLKAYNMKLPGTYYMYALIMSIFGKTNTGIHTGLIVMNAFTMIILYYVIKDIFNHTVAFISAVGYGLMAASPFTLGFAVHATHFINFFVAIGLLFINRYWKTGKWFHLLLSGVMMGMAFLMKQQAVFFILFGASLLFLNLPTNKNIFLSFIKIGAIFALGVLAPYLINAFILLKLGAFDKFWFWTYEYASKYASGGTAMNGMKIFMSLFPPIFNEYILIWLSAIAGLLIVIKGKFQRNQKIFAISFFLFSMSSVFPGLYFRQHYFITLLPAIGLLSGIALDQLNLWLHNKYNYRILRYAAVMVLILNFMNVVSQNKTYYLNPDVNQICKAAYFGNPFIEAIPIGKFIKQNTNKDDKIAIMGSEPEIFFYSDRQSATGYIYTYGMVEQQPFNLKMQEEMISEIENSKPKIIMFASINYSWLAQPNTPDTIFKWFNKYSAEGYNVIGMIDMLPQGTNYYWNNDAIGVKPQAENYIVLFKRKD